MSKELIEELRATFEYHPDGYLIRKKTGKPCGQCVNRPNGYVAVGVGGRMLYAHRHAQERSVARLNLNLTKTVARHCVTWSYELCLNL